MLVKYIYMLLCGCSRFHFPLETCMYCLLLIIRAVSILLFFWRSTGDSAPACATFWRFCFQLLCSVFGGQICFKEAIMLVKYSTLWLFVLPLSLCNLYILFSSHFRLIYSRLSWRHRIFLLPRSQCCVQRMYACSLCIRHVCKVYICVHTTPRHTPHFVGDGEIN